MRKSLLLCLVWLTCHARGTTPEAFAQSSTHKTVYKDYDGDGHGDPTKPKSTLNPVQGYVALADDCNDKDPTIYKGAPEIKDGKDNDCDGMKDEVDAIWYQDSDGDGYGGSVSKEAAEQPAGYVSRGGDANDNDDTIYPGAPELCDGKDNDQDGQVDDNPTNGTTYYQDADNDSYGNPNNSVQACEQPVGYVTNNGDCDDNDGGIHPNQWDGCNYTDDDCDGQEDEDQGWRTWYYDGDDDGWGDPCNEDHGCDGSPDGYVLRAGDCDDSDPTVYNCGDGCDDYMRKASPDEPDQRLSPVTSLHPNPATSELTIDLSRPAKELKSITISTVIDQKVSFTNYAVLGDSKVKITVTHLKSGVYVIRLDFGDGFEVLKFIKN